MKRSAIPLLPFLLFASVAAGQAYGKPLIGAGESVRTLAEQYLLQSVNAERAEAGLPALHWNATLWRAARFHAGQMSAARTLSHQLGGEPDLTARAATAGARFSRVTENVAVGPSILQMHDALMRSPHHRENILDGAVDSIAISVVSDGRELWAVEDFSRDVEVLGLTDQEERVSLLLRRAGVSAAPTPEARATCGQDSGYVGERPAFVMRYTTGDLQRLPEQLRTRLAEGAFSSVAVGACPADKTGGFTSYSLAVVLYR